ncbi:response regulator [Sorangium sp. So ce834]|uniref:response regulator transcription factor n=1 Tax=Sorangium sp. So ce834 TaxID=3133321 RepID=UPI003F5D830B
MTDVTAKVVVIDDDGAVLRSVGRLLGASGYEVELFEGARAFLASAAGAPDARAGCVIVDLAMPELGGLDLQAALRASGCRLPLIFITGHGDVRASVQAMKEGAVDFLLKPLEADELLAAVRRAMDLDARARAARGEQAALAARLDALTPRERQVCDRIARGQLNKQIAAELGLAESTVKQHRASATAKLGVASAAELAALLERSRGRDG